MVEMLVQRRSVVEGLLRSAIVLGLFYVFLVAISMLGSVFKEMGHGQAETLVTQLSPLASLAVGILATVLVQSSSVTTSLVVGVVATSPSGSLLESIQPFVPMIMGANIGTTITNTLASLGHVTRTREFERAFAGATVHDFFNLLTVLILLPLELATGFLSRTAVWLVEVLQLSSSVEFHSPVKAVVKVGETAVRGLVKGAVGEGTPYYVLVIVLAVIFIFVCLGFITRNMKLLLASRLEGAINRALEKSGLLGILIGILVTVAVQSSSITTSILVPMFGAGVLTLANGYPIMLGANVGTTITALLAAVVKGPAGLAIALVHLLFNILGILLFYPVPALRRIPIRLAQWLAARTVDSKWYILLYVLGVFVAIPVMAFVLFR